MLGLSSQERLKCSQEGSGCVGSLHTYMWKKPKTVCVYREVRTVKGRFSTTDFLPEDDELYKQLIVGKQSLPINCRAGTIYLTIFQDIVLSVKQGTFQHNMVPIEPEAVLTGAEISPSLFSINGGRQRGRKWRWGGK